MRVETFLKTAIATLQSAGISTARLDCLVLLEDVLNTNRTHLLAHPEFDLTEVELAELNKLIQKRAQHIPLAYLRGKTEFYGREFIVSAAVLEPRPESEAIIDILKSLNLPTDAKVLDVGSGSGALGITAKLELPNIQLTLLEIDSAALSVTKHNAQLHNIEAQYIQNDLLQNLDERFDTLLCNLPYVPDGFHINLAASHEPKLAIFGGEDGLDLYRKLFREIRHSHQPNFVITESLPPQHPELAAIARQAGFQQSREVDFIQLFELSP